MSTTTGRSVLSCGLLLLLYLNTISSMTEAPTTASMINVSSTTSATPDSSETTTEPTPTTPTTSEPTPTTPTTPDPTPTTATTPDPTPTTATTSDPTPTTPTTSDPTPTTPTTPDPSETTTDPTPTTATTPDPTPTTPTTPDPSETTTDSTPTTATTPDPTPTTPTTPDPSETTTGSTPTTPTTPDPTPTTPTTPDPSESTTESTTNGTSTTPSTTVFSSIVSTTSNVTTFANASTVSITSINSSFISEDTTSATTSLLTISTTRPTATTPSGSIKPNYGSIKYKLNFTLAFLNVSWDPSLEDKTSTQFINAASQLERQVNNAFFVCLGFEKSQVTSFSEYSPVLSSDVSGELFQTGGVVADYQTIYAGDVFDEKNPDEIINIILKNVLPELSSVQLNDSSADADYINKTMPMELDLQGQTWYSTACQSNPNACDLCFNCNQTYVTVLCLPKCSATKNEYCQVSAFDASSTTCSCQPNYLPVAGDCVHQDWVIGLSAGIGGAIVVGLVIAVILLAVYKPSSSKSSSSKDRLDNDFESAPFSSPLDDIPSSSAAMVNSSFGIQGLESDDISLTELGVKDGLPQHSTFGITAAVVAASSASADDNNTLVSESASEQQKQLEQQTADAARQQQLIEQQEQLQQLNSQVQQQQEQLQQLQQQQQQAPTTTFSQSSSAYNANVQDFQYQSMIPEQTDAASFSTFTPQLQNVDLYTDFAIKRPKALTTQNTTPQNSTYYQFF